MDIIDFASIQIETSGLDSTVSSFISGSPTFFSGQIPFYLLPTLGLASGLDYFIVGSIPHSGGWPMLALGHDVSSGEFPMAMPNVHANADIKGPTFFIHGNSEV